MSEKDTDSRRTVLKKLGALSIGSAGASSVVFPDNVRGATDNPCWEDSAVNSHEEEVTAGTKRHRQSSTLRYYGSQQTADHEYLRHEFELDAGCLVRLNDYSGEWVPDYTITSNTIAIDAPSQIIETPDGINGLVGSTQTSGTGDINGATEYALSKVVDLLNSTVLRFAWEAYEFFDQLIPEDTYDYGDANIEYDWTSNTSGDADVGHAARFNVLTDLDQAVDFTLESSFESVPRMSTQWDVRIDEYTFGTVSSQSKIGTENHATCFNVDSTVSKAPPYPH